MLSRLQTPDLIIIFVCILVSMAIHEAMHAFVAHWLGDTTAKDEGRLSLNPLKHIDLYTTILLPILLILLRIPPFFIAKPVPFNPTRVKYEEFGAALIGIAGPLTNLCLAVLGSFILKTLDFGSPLFNIIDIFIVINLGFFVFNMIPFPPLDGSRLLYAFAPEPLQKVMYQIESMGISAIFLFMFLFFSFLSPMIRSIINSLYNFLV